MPHRLRRGGIAEAFLIGRDFIGRDRVGLIPGDNLFYGNTLPAMAERGAEGRGAVIYAYQVGEPCCDGVAEFDPPTVRSASSRNRAEPRSNWAVSGPPLYDGGCSTSPRGLQRSRARGVGDHRRQRAVPQAGNGSTVEKLGRGYARLDTGTRSNLLRAAHPSRRSGSGRACRSAAPRRWAGAWAISMMRALRAIEPIKQSEYAKYLGGSRRVSAPSFPCRGGACARALFQKVSGLGRPGDDCHRLFGCAWKYLHNIIRMAIKHQYVIEQGGRTDLCKQSL